MDNNKKPQQKDTSDENLIPNRPDEKQIIPPKGEKYLRESGNIEDLPDPSEEDEVNSQK